MSESLQHFVNTYLRLTEAEQALFLDAFSFRPYPARHRIVDYNQVSREAFFIEKGCVRLYYLKDGTEFTSFIFTENLVASSFESFLKGTPSIQILETIEPCEVWVISYQKLEQLYEQLPQTNILMRKLLEERLLNSQKILASFILDNPEERYLEIVAQNPAMLQRIPQHQLATLLGITPVSLSRIRKRLLKK
jgi:CRP/FNR family transcriptional regulator, anaerobic regulatory protein